MDTLRRLGVLRETLKTKNEHLKSWIIIYSMVLGLPNEDCYDWKKEKIKNLVVDNVRMSYDIANGRNPQGNLNWRHRSCHFTHPNILPHRPRKERTNLFSP